MGSLFEKGDSMAEEVTNESREGALLNLSMGAWIGIAVAALVVGILLGRFALGGGAAGALNKATLTEAELNTVVGTYTYNGKSNSLTARQVIEQNSTLDSAKDADGNYKMPSADNVLSVARNMVIASEADARGITVSDDDLSSYAEDTLGTSDFASIATSYGMDEETVKALLRQSAQMSKLRDEVVSTDDAGEAPEAPKTPEVPTKDEEGNDLSEEAKTAAQEEANKAVTKEYADYIIKLAGDEWDAEAGKFKSEDGPYATALADYEVKKDGASYEAAQAAYYVAYQDYSTKQSEISTQWTDFVNGLLGNSSISISTMVA